MQYDGAFEHRPPPPWFRSHGVDAVLDHWRSSEAIAPNIALDVHVDGSEALSVPISDQIAPAVRYALKARGIDRLFSHQAEAFEAVARRRDLVVATPTASGKSLCYTLPVLDALARDHEARALFLFPTKALSRDQELSLRRFLTDAGIERGAVTYDGDTPQDARRAARDKSAVVITNPDMLHAGILPQHASWARFFANLRFVVIDELHVYRGVFGSHLGNLLRRLFRVAAFHGAEVRLICCSATIGNPKEHAERLSGREVELISRSGAPSAGRRVLVYNPPVVNAELGIRQSYVKTAVRLTTDLVRAQVPVLVFGQSRNQVEVMLKYLRDAMPELDPAALAAYRGGYLANTRRKIEEGLREGSIRCVVATNALELGIDIGALDAVICAGHPGTMAALWQRFGRAGRRRGESLGVLVASSAPLDQYLAKHARSIVEAPIERARIDPDNIEILIQHLKCAAFELPFELGERFGDVDSESVADALGFLADHSVVRAVQGRGGKTLYHWTADVFPANEVSLRSAGWDNFAIVDVEAERTIAEMDFRSSHTMLHEQAIYQQDGEQYQVEVLDFENHKAFVRKVEPDYYTTAMTHTKVSVLELEASGATKSISTGWGDVEVIEKVVGFKKIKFHTHENVGYGEVHLPRIEKPTTAFWATFPEALLGLGPGPGHGRGAMLDAIAGYGAALKAVAAVGLMMDPRDLGIAVVDERALESAPSRDSGSSFEPTLYLYDAVAGGVGLAARLFEEQGALLVRAQQLVATCECEAGCPSCIGPPGASEEISARKPLLLELLVRAGIG